MQTTKEKKEHLYSGSINLYGSSNYIRKDAFSEKIVKTIVKELNLSYLFACRIGNSPLFYLLCKEKDAKKLREWYLQDNYSQKYLNIYGEDVKVGVPCVYETVRYTPGQQGAYSWEKIKDEFVSGLKNSNPNEIVHPIEYPAGHSTEYPTKTRK